LCLIFIGFGIALFSSPNTNAVMSSVHKKFYGVASGILGTMRLTGQAFSMGIVTLILALHMGRVQITPLYFNRFLQSSRTSFILFTLLCFGGIFASLAWGKIQGSIYTLPLFFIYTLINSYYRSTVKATPWPPPIHSVAIPFLALRFIIS